MIRELVAGLVTALFLVILHSVAALAGDVTVLIVDDAGTPVPDAVITLQDGTAPDSPSPTDNAVMVQQSEAFSPFVLPVHVGTVVEFPNKDPFRHHVYSFSPARTFEIKLYGGEETQRVMFDRPGAVALGCNIHDDMLAYIYVVDGEAFAKTDINGRATLTTPDADSTTVSVWHPRMRGAPEDRTIDTASSDIVTITLPLKPERRRRRTGFDAVDY